MSESSSQSDPLTMAGAQDATPVRRQRLSGRWNKLRPSPKNSVFSLALLLLFHAVLYYQFTAPDHRLPSLLQRLVAFADAAFVAAVVSLMLEDWRRRFQRRGTLGAAVAADESADGFGVDWASVLGFILALSLWLSPWAPIKIAEERAAMDSPQIPAAESIPASPH